MAGKQNVALVVGSTGITGEALVELLTKPDTAGGPWKVYGIARRPKPEWHTPDVYIRCDLLNREETLAKVSPFTDVTHVFYVTWADLLSEVENCEANGEMLQNLLDALLPNAKGLQHVSLQTGGKHYAGSFDQWAVMNDRVEFPDAPYTEDMPRLPGDNFFYTLEDVLFQTVEQKKGQGEELTWSVHRPGLIFGFTIGNKMNMLSTLSVYGCLCKELGLPLIFPGPRSAWDSFCDASDAELIAEQHVWAATDPRAKNHAFNCMNGDVFKWKRMWGIVAERLGMKAEGPRTPPLALQQLMKGMGPVWKGLVKKYSLHPTELPELGHWWFAEIFLANYGCDSVMSTNKSKEFGFLKFRNTLKGVAKHLDRYAERKIFPKVK
ncbi:unnamed protein product [Calypogeia fissa]